MGDVTVLVADGQRLFAECLALMLDQEPDITVAPRNPTTGLAVMEVASRQRPDVVILDYWIPGPTDGATLTSELVALLPSVRVLLLSWTHGPQHAQAGLRAGAAGFLPKGLTLVQLLAAIHRAHEGEALVFADELASLLDDMDRRGEEAEERWNRLCTLTPREVEILQLLAEGRPGAEVAAQLHMAGGSLKTAVHQLLRKLGVRNQLEAVAMARRERLLDAPSAPGTTGSHRLTGHHGWTP